MNLLKWFRCAVAPLATFLATATASASSDIAVVIDAPYRVPDKYVSTSFGATPELAVQVWWEKYKQYWGVEPYGELTCDYQIQVGNEGVLGRYGRVRLTGQCTGSDPIEGTIGCPSGYTRVGDICRATGEPVAEKNTPAPCDSTSRPVNYTTGNKFLLETDLPDWNGQGMPFQRAWNAFDGRWRFSYRQRLVEVQTSLHTASIYQDTGRVVRFNDVDGQWTPDPDVRGSLVRDGNGWYYTLASGQKQWFDDRGRLSRVSYPEGKLVTLDYVGDALIEVRDAYGNLLALELDSESRVKTVTDPDGQVYRYQYDSDGRLVFVGYPDDTPGASGANPFGEDNPVREYHYEDARHPTLVTGVTDENGDRYLTVAYDDLGRAVLSGLADGSVDSSQLEYTYLGDPVDPRVTVTNALGKSAVYHLENYQGVNRVSLVEGVASANCLADSSERSYYPGTGWLERNRDKEGSSTYHEYFADTGRYGLPRLRVEGEGTPEERRYTFDWEPDSRRLVSETLEGRWQADYRYDVQGRLLNHSVTDLTLFTQPYSSQGRGRVWDYQYSFFDPEQTQVAEILLDGPRTDVPDITRYEYSSRGFLLSVTNPAGHVTRYSDHNGRGQPGRMKDANGVETRYQWSPRGLLLSSEVENGSMDAVTGYGYDAVGNLTDLSLPDGRQLSYYYDAARQLIQVVDALGNRIVYSRDAAGNVTLETTEDGAGLVRHSVEYAYDELSRMRVMTSPAHSARTDSWRYTAGGDISEFQTGFNPPRVTTYDSLGRGVGVTHPDGHRSRYGYDTQDNPSMVEDQRGLVTTYQYDGLGNLMLQVSPDTGRSSYHYDPAGNLVSVIDAEGRHRAITYDVLNRPILIAYDDDRLDVHLDYDDSTLGDYQLGRLGRVRDAAGSQAWIYDALGQTVGNVNILDGQAYTWLFNYDPGGNLLSMTYPGGRRVDYSRDILARVSGVNTVSGPGGDIEALVSRLQYLPFGPLESFTYGNGLRRSLDYDLAYAPESLVLEGEGLFMDRGYEISPEGTILGIDQRVYPVGSQIFAYDVQGRLRAAESQSYGDHRYDYDGAGNRIHEWRDLDIDGAADWESDYEYSMDSNRLASITRPGDASAAMDYDNTGNLVADNRSARSLEYDAGNRLAGVVIDGAGTGYIYNGLGQRVIKVQTDGNAIHFHYGPGGELLLESRADGSTIREYIYLEGQPVAMVAEDQPDVINDVDADGVADEIDNCRDDFNTNQSDYDGDGIGNVCDPEQLTSYSLGEQDGWVRESREASGIGGKLNRSSGRGIRVGDYKKNRQYRAILSFRLESLPEGARVSGAILELSRKSDFEVGSPAALGAIGIDVNLGSLSGSPDLEIFDFEAPAGLPDAARLQDGTTARASFGRNVLDLLESAVVQGGAVVQMRLHTQLATDGNGSDDYLYYYSGEQGTESRRPRLVLEYQLAD